MGVDYSFYIQYREKDEWKNLPIYDVNHNLVSINDCGREKWEWIREEANRNVDENEIYQLGIEAGWVDPTEKENEFELAYYNFSFAHLKYLALKDYPDENEYEEGWGPKDFWQTLKDKVYLLLNIANIEWMHPDNIRIIVFVGY